MKFRLSVALGLALSVTTASTSLAESCLFSDWFVFKGTQLKRYADETAYLYFTSHSRIDADGAPNSYHPQDASKACLKKPYFGLDCPQNAGYPGTSWWQSVLAVDPADPSKPFVQPDGPTKGFFVSSTWLSAPGKSVTDPARYVDAATVPYVVFPGSKFAKLAGTGSKGDVGIAYNLANGESTAFIVADQGGGSDAKLGEGSIALYLGLGGKNIDARTGSGVASGEMLFVVFPNSRSGISPVWPRSNESIETQVDDLVESVGGFDSMIACR